MSSKHTHTHVMQTHTYACQANTHIRMSIYIYTNPHTPDHMQHLQDEECTSRGLQRWDIRIHYVTCRYKKQYAFATVSHFFFLMGTALYSAAVPINKKKCVCHGITYVTQYTIWHQQIKRQLTGILRWSTPSCHLNMHLCGAMIYTISPRHTSTRFRLDIHPHDIA